MSALGIVVRGRLAWIVGLIFGVILLIIGLTTSNTFLTIVGAGFAIFGLVFLIISIVTKGGAD
jgi:hypothetical protein